MDVSVERSQRTHRRLVAWFSSPRVAARSAIRLSETVPSFRVRIRPEADHGAEGPVVPLVADVPWLWSSIVTRQLTGLGVTMLWDPRSEDIDVGTLR
jgi:hypothetical protein